VRWLLKAAVQKAAGSLPRSDGLNYVFQRRVLKTLPLRAETFRQKFSRAVQHVDAYREHVADAPKADAVAYEFGAGWDLVIPLAYWSLGFERQILVDIRPHLRLELVNDAIGRYDRLRNELESAADRPLRPLGPPLRTLEELRERFGIEYLAPRDARATGLEAESIDFVSSTNTLEHVPVEDIRSIFRECARLLRPEGVLSCRIDLRDHYAYFDRSLSPYNFLRFSERTWRLFNSPVHFQNRLRYPDYLRLAEEAGLRIVSESRAAPSPEELDVLRSLPLAPEFRSGYSPDELGGKSLAMVARPARAERLPDAPE
jgi:SAM-dependent methyltransferase